MAIRRLNRRSVPIVPEPLTQLPRLSKRVIRLALRLSPGFLDRADVSFPVIIAGRGWYQVALDGRHRICKAIWTGRTELPTVRVPFSMSSSWWSRGSTKWSGSSSTFGASSGNQVAGWTFRRRETQLLRSAGPVRTLDVPGIRWTPTDHGIPIGRHFPAGGRIRRGQEDVNTVRGLEVPDPDDM